jgi:hypothetical protein
MHNLSKRFEHFDVPVRLPLLPSTGIHCIYCVIFGADKIKI